jgi:hypothetical protein
LEGLELGDEIGCFGRLRLLELRRQVRRRVLPLGAGRDGKELVKGEDAGLAALPAW